MERGNKAAIVIADPDIEAMPVESLTSEWGTCVWLKGDFGELFDCLVYCKPKVELDGYVTYLEEVARCSDTKLVTFAGGSGHSDIDVSIGNSEHLSSVELTAVTPPEPIPSPGKRFKTVCVNFNEFREEMRRRVTQQTLELPAEQLQLALEGIVTEA